METNNDNHQSLQSNSRFYSHRNRGKSVMKRFAVLFLLTAIFLTACSAKVYEADGVRLTVDWKKYQVSDGQDIYKFYVSGTEDREEVLIIYPDGSRQTVIAGNGTVLQIASEGSDESADYISPRTLYAAIDSQRPVNFLSLKPVLFSNFDPMIIILLILSIISIISILIGIYCLVAPESAWHLFAHWIVRDNEPSERGLKYMRITGVCFILEAVLIIIYILTD